MYLHVSERLYSSVIAVARRLITRLLLLLGGGGLVVVSDIDLSLSFVPSTDGDCETGLVKAVSVPRASGDPLFGIDVSFSVIDGPNKGTKGTSKSEINGVATFFYRASPVGGRDLIEATFVDSKGVLQRSTRTSVPISCPCDDAGSAVDFLDATGECVRTLICSPGEFVAEPATVTSDRICSICLAGSFSAGRNSEECTAWQECEPGVVEHTEPSSSSDRGCGECLVCDVDEYKPGPCQCSICKTCPPGMVESAPCTMTNDRECNSCEAETFTTRDNSKLCFVHTICNPGSFVKKPATVSSDRVCESCAAGSFSSESNSPACSIAAKCPIGLFESKPPTPTSDRSCSKCLHTPVIEPPTTCSGGLSSPTSGTGWIRLPPGHPQFSELIDCHNTSCIAWSVFLPFPPALSGFVLDINGCRFAFIRVLIEI